MFVKLRFLFRDPIVKYSVFVALFFIVAQIIALVFGIKPQEEPVFLHYTTYLGVDFIGAWYLSYLIPIMSLVFVIINLVIAYVFLNKDKLLRHILAVNSALLSLLLLIHAILLAIINS